MNVVVYVFTYVPRHNDVTNGGSIIKDRHAGPTPLAAAPPWVGHLCSRESPPYSVLALCRETPTPMSMEIVIHVFVHF